MTDRQKIMGVIWTKEEANKRPEEYCKDVTIHVQLDRRHPDKLLVSNDVFREHTGEESWESYSYRLSPDPDDTDEDYLP